MTRRELAARPGWRIHTSSYVSLCGLATITGSTNTKRRGVPKYRCNIPLDESASFDRLSNAVRWCESRLLEKIKPIAQVAATNPVINWEPEPSYNTGERLLEI